MTVDLEFLPPTLRRGEPATEEQLSLLEQAVGAPLPQQYRAFLRQTNGAAGAVGDGYVHLYSSDDVADAKRTVDLPEMPGFLLVGSNGGGMAIGLSASEGEVFVVPWDSLDPEYVRPRAPSFSEFLRRLCDTPHESLFGLSATP